MQGQSVGLWKTLLSFVHLFYTTVSYRLFLKLLKLKQVVFKFPLKNSTICVIPKALHLIMVQFLQRVNVQGCRITHILTLFRRSHDGIPKWNWIVLVVFCFDLTNIVRQVRVSRWLQRINIVVDPARVTRLLVKQCCLLLE